MARSQLQPGEIGAKTTELEAAATKSGAKPVEPGMAGSGLGAQAIRDQMADIHDKVEKQKIPLSKGVAAYTRENLRKVAGKLQAGEPIYPSDMEFIANVRMWMGMPAVWREKYRSIEQMKTEGGMDGSESREVGAEAQKRNISWGQWLALMHIACFNGTKGKEKEWIDGTFNFPGDGSISSLKKLKLKGNITVLPENIYVMGGEVDLTGCTGLTALPENLKVRYLNMAGCTGITVFPDSLDVGFLNLTDCTGVTVYPENVRKLRHLDMTGCTNLTVLPKKILHNGLDLNLTRCTGITVLPEELDLNSLDLTGCTGITSLPKKLKVGLLRQINLTGCTGLKALPGDISAFSLFLAGCTGLTALPKDLDVSQIYLSQDLKEKVKRDAERLAKKGKNTSVKYINY
jgi:hypothetical protein